MIRIRRAAIALGLTLALQLLAGGGAQAQDVTGKITGRVTDKDSGQALSGVTVIVQGPQGDDATLTDATGDYYFSTLPSGTYVIRFYVANSSTKTEQGGVIVSADKTVRVNARVAGQAAAAAAQETYVITRRPPAIDVGASHVGTTFDSNFNTNVPVGRDFGDLIEKAPGAFLDRTGSVSIAGATGLENIYLVDGLNVTGAEFGNINSNSPTLGGGSNFPVEFLDQMSVNTGGYNAEFGGAMGGVINAVTKSGTNDLHGSVFSYWSPYFLAGDPTAVRRIGGAISSKTKPDYDTTIGVEVGGPIIKNKLFFWAGFSPRFEEDHVFRYTNSLVEVPGESPAFGPEVDRRRITEPRKTYHYGLKIDFVPAPDHRLTLSLFGSPSSGQGMRSFLGVGAISDPTWAREAVNRNTTDVTARWVSKLDDRKWLIEANVGLHKESFNNFSPIASLNGLNQEEWWGANLWDLEHTPGCQPVTGANGGVFQPCPVDNYHNGGFGLEKKFDAWRWTGELKSTHLFDAGGHHELKYGLHAETTQFNQDRYYSGPLGARALIAHYPTFVRIQNFFSLPPGILPYQAVATPQDLQVSPAYQDHLPADVKNLIGALFIQDSYSLLPNLTINAGVRGELQNMYDSHGARFLSLQDIAPRIGVVFDPTNDGRSKIFAHFGQYYEAIPMSIAARYFGGEGLVIHVTDPTTCTNPPANWTGNGTTEWRTCARDTNPGNYFEFNNGANYPVQPRLQGQYHSEVVAGVQREVMEDLVLGLDYTHRWLGSIIEDGTAYSDGTFILANPGAVPKEALSDYQAQIDKYQAQVIQHTAEVMNATTADAKAQAEAALTSSQQNLSANQTYLTNLRGLAAEPKPERTYDALTLFVDKRFSRRWLVHASYTYSRLVGNYEGLYQDHQDYFAPNGSNAYDTQDLVLNARGRLPNDHPHSGRVDGYYMQPIGKGSLVLGLGFAARSGQPREYISNLGGNGQLVFLLPRGSGGRTPPITQFDGKFSYRRPLTDKTGLELFVDVFNLFNQQAKLRTDDDYTFDSAAPIVNGTKDDLKYAKNANGQPLAVNPNYGRAISYQAPIHGRLGLRLTF